MFVYGVAVSIGIGIVIAIEYFLLNTTPLVLPIIVGIISVLGLFYVIIRMSFLQIIAFDKQNSSLKKRLLHSWNITKGSVSKTVALVIAAGLFNMTGLLFFGIGTIVTLPITGLALAFFYKKLDNAYSQEPEQVQELATEITQNNFEE